MSIGVASACAHAALLFHGWPVAWTRMMPYLLSGSPRPVLTGTAFGARRRGGIGALVRRPTVAATVQENQGEIDHHEDRPHRRVPGPRGRRAKSQSQHSAFVLVHTDDGLVGIGEASPMQGGLASLAMLEHHIAPGADRRRSAGPRRLLDRAAARRW